MFIFNRSTALAFATAIVLTAVHGNARAQPFPAKPVRFVVPFPAGSQTDIVARIMSPKLGEIWGQPLIIENRPGGSGTLGASIVAKAAPDGHTLLFTSSSFAISAALHPNLPYHPLNDFAGVTQIGFTTGVLVVAPSLGVRSVKELIALARQRPGKLLFGSAGAGSSTHLNSERFRFVAGIDAVHVGFKGQAEFIVELLAGRIHFAIAGMGPALPFIKDGRLLPLAVITPSRSPVMPDVPALAEILPTYEKDGSYALLAPRKTAPPLVGQISKDVARVLELPDIRQKLQNISFVPAPTTPGEHDRILRSQIETFGRVVRTAGLRPQ